MEKLREKKVIATILILGIIVWQYRILTAPITDSHTGKQYTRTDATGLNFAAASSFTYFYYYLNLYPIAAQKEYLKYSREEAIKLLHNLAIPLFTDNSFYILWGEHGKSLILLFDAGLKNSPESLTVKNFNFVVFVSSLILLLVSAFIYKQAVFGILFTVFMGSNPFLIYELYGRENIFGLGGVMLIFCLAFLFPLIFSKKQLNKYYLIATSVVLGLVLGFMAHIRTEYLVVALSCVFVYWTSKTVTPKNRLLLTLLFLFSFLVCSRGLELYFNNLIETTYSKLGKSGRTPPDVKATRATYHKFWHPLYVGLSDFDNKYGIAWSDAVAYKKAEKYLMDKYPEKYRVMPNREEWSVQPEYNEFIKQEVVTLLKNDPLWYVGIVGKRIIKLFSNVTPLGVSLDSNFYKIPLSGWVFLPTTILLIKKKQFEYLKVLLFSISLSIPIIAIHSSKNITGISVYHIFNIAILASLAINFLLNKYAMRSLPKK